MKRFFKTLTAFAVVVFTKVSEESPKETTDALLKFL